MREKKSLDEIFPRIVSAGEVDLFWLRLFNHCAPQLKGGGQIAT